MNLYLLLAIAFGAITGTTEVPAVRTVRAGVTSECRIRAHEQAAIATKIDARRARATAAAPAENHTVARVDAPLAGAATPRAPAASC